MMKTLATITFLALELTLTLPAQTAAPASDLTGTEKAIESPAATIDHGLPSWLIFGGDYRTRFEGYGGLNFKPNTTDDFLLSRLKLDLTIKPTSWMRFFIEGMDARALEKNPALPTFQNTWDIRQGYGEIGDFEGGLWGIRAGRQEFSYGDERLLGPSWWSNTERNEDAIRGRLSYKGYRLDIFAASIVNEVTGTWDHHQQGNNLHGAYGHIDKLGPRLIIEPYAMWRLQHGIKDEENHIGKLNEKIGGLRLAGTKLPKGFDYGAEMVREFGSYGADKIQTWGGHWVVGWTANARYTPRFYGEFNFAGGDKHPTDGIHATFDQLYPSGHDKLGFADQIGWRNIKDVRSGMSFVPKKNVNVAFEYNDWWLDSATDALYNVGGVAAFRSITGAAGTHVGQETDITGTWKFAKAFTAGAGFCHIFPGEFLKNVTPGSAYTYPYMMMLYTF